jgi:hypothetical protein
MELDSLFVIGGPGTYVFLGPSETGKNHLFRHQFLEAAGSTVKPTNIIIYSTTHDICDDFDFLTDKQRRSAGILPRTKVYSTSDYNHVISALDKIRDTIRNLKLANLDYKRWTKENETLVVVNDYIGMGNFSTIHSWALSLAAKARHLGVYFVLFTQYSPTLGSGIWISARVVVSFDKSTRTTLKLNEVLGKSGDATAITSDTLCCGLTDGNTIRLCPVMCCSAVR